MNVSIVPPDRVSGTWFIAGDWHSFHLHYPSFNILIKHALRFPKKDRRLIINGDLCDFEFLMKKNEHYKKWIKRSDGIEEFFLPNYEAEINCVNTMLDRLLKVFSKIVFLSGNHDWPRTQLFQRVCPAAYKPHFDLLRSLKLRERGIMLIPYNSWLDLGNLSITHGMFHGTTALKKHFEASGGRSVIFSHIHHSGSKSFMSRGKTKQVWSLPAMCQLNPAYIKNSETNWSNGYGLIQMRKSGVFNFYTFQVWDKQLVLPCGTILKGSKNYESLK